MENSERRREKRHSIDLDGRYRISDTTNHDTYNLAIFNVSRGGFCFLAREDLNKDDEIEMVVELEAAEEVSLRLRIMWSEAMEAGLYMCGAKLFDGNEAENLRLRRFCETRLLYPPPIGR
jgi:c-di-GMP-binding flagellar brake protein YcgR